MDVKWWARQDSNLQPDRYERSALTIELQAQPDSAGRTIRIFAALGTAAGAGSEMPYVGHFRAAKRAGVPPALPQSGPDNKLTPAA